MQNTATELERILDEARPRLLALDAASVEKPLVAEKWSRKEILGHLIDSAANNHQRFVRLQIEAILTLPSYRQPDWVRVQHYQQRRCRPCWPAPMAASPSIRDRERARLIFRSRARGSFKSPAI